MDSQADCYRALGIYENFYSLLFNLSYFKNCMLKTYTSTLKKALDVVFTDLFLQPSFPLSSALPRPEQKNVICFNIFICSWFSITILKQLSLYREIWWKDFHNKSQPTISLWFNNTALLFPVNLIVTNWSMFQVSPTACTK